MLPDPAFYSEQLKDSFDELYEAAAAPREEKKRERPAARTRKSKKAAAENAPAANGEAPASVH
jgi:hypothetical protein